jgi:large subunit ribosomal protein L29
MKAREMREQSAEQLQQTLKERQADLINFRLQQATGVVENVRAAREARKDIARIKTVLRAREVDAAKKGESES